MFVNIYASNKPETIKSIIVWAAGFLLVGYQILNVFVPNADMIIYARILDTAATAVALIIFFPDTWHGFWRAIPKPRDFLIVGIWLKFLSAELQSIYALLYRLGGSPAWWLNNELLGVTVLISVIAVVCHVATPGTVEGVVPRRNQYGLAIGFGAALLVILSFVANKPDIAPWLEMTRPYISDWWKSTTSSLNLKNLRST